MSIFFGCGEMNEHEAAQVLQNFYNDNVPEPINDRYLLEAGKAIVPFLLEEIKDPDMPKRGYAILALGKIGDVRALGTLEQILDDKSETDYIRGDSLTSIWHIDRKVGEKLSIKYHGENRYIDRTIELLKKGDI